MKRRTGRPTGVVTLKAYFVSVGGSCEQFGFIIIYYNERHCSKRLDVHRCLNQPPIRSQAAHHQMVKITSNGLMTVTGTRTSAPSSECTASTTVIC